MYEELNGLMRGSEDNNENREALIIMKRVFLSNDGQFALARILETCKFIEQCDNEADMALNNFAKDLLTTIYTDANTGSVNSSKIMSVVKKLIRRK